jgi:hypothetical protein
VIIRDGERMVNTQSHSDAEGVSSGDLLQSRVTIVNNNVLRISK